MPGEVCDFCDFPLGPPYTRAHAQRWFQDEGAKVAIAVSPPAPMSDRRIEHRPADLRLAAAELARAGLREQDVASALGIGIGAARDLLGSLRTTSSGDRCARDVHPAPAATGATTTEVSDVGQ
jgi:hypothetical protein